VATIRTNNGVVLLKNGLASCTCCGELPPSESCRGASEFVIDYSNYPPQEGANTFVGGYYTIPLTNAEYLLYTTTPSAQMRESYTASITMRHNYPTIGVGTWYVEFDADVEDFERVYTRGQNDNVNTQFETNVTAFGDCGLNSFKRIGYKLGSNVTGRATVGGLYTNCNLLLSDEPAPDLLVGGNLFRTITIFVKDDRNVPDLQKTHLALFSAVFEPVGLSVTLRNPFSNDTQTNKIFDYRYGVRFSVESTYQPTNSLSAFPGILTPATSSATVLGRNIPLLARLYSRDTQSDLGVHPCRLVSANFNPTLSIVSNLNLSMTYALEFLPPPP
jgi:hypothetical protein